MAGRNSLDLARGDSDQFCADVLRRSGDGKTCQQWEAPDNSLNYVRTEGTNCVPPVAVGGRQSCSEERC